MEITIKSSSENPKTIADNINHYMNYYKISRKELAERLNVSTATVGYWCTGKKIPRMSKIDEMCKIFNVKRKNIVSEREFVIRTVKNGPLISVKSSLTKPVTDLDPDEEQIINLYRQKNYKEIINLMMEKL